MSVILTGNDLTLNELSNIVYDREKVELHPDYIKKIVKCRDYVDKIIEEDRVVYGLTTGFGKFANIRISTEHIEELQRNLILSHATGVGEILSIEETRVVMLLRINVLVKGHSGIRLSTLQTLIEMLNKGVHPCIPEKGSVGASGDLAPLSHLALVLLGEGEAEYNGNVVSGSKALELAKIKPVVLKAKEGLALNNGTQVMTGVGALNLLRAERLCKVADVVASMSIDALMGTGSAFDALVHNLRPHAGQKESAKNLNSLLKESELNCSHKYCSNVQDAYSLRCTPQVNGAVRDALKYIRNTIEIEMNSATDNPLIFPDEDKVISGGNFHGEPVAFAMDTMAFTVSELANISDRRTEQLLNPALNNDLNPFLAPRPGLDSGFMMTQVTSAALVSENKVLSHPASVDSIPTSANQEDHVSMGTIGAFKARTILDNASVVLAIELMNASQALDYRKIQSSPALEAVKKEVRKIVAHLDHDRIMTDDINNLTQIIDSDIIPNIVDKFIELQ
ncbi:MAG: histidine ammonia-lyase [Candidatus Cloacimonetes bacterium]|nr:histidine ammonia-lyase [Candidatus Cloacimonadota bacterium]MBT5420335.1 histidine ammonia-lyase [Candidatus Cloacimonadota bacterium]